LSRRICALFTAVRTFTRTLPDNTGLAVGIIKPLYIGFFDFMLYDRYSQYINKSIGFS